MTSTWPLILGAAKPALFPPSLLTAVPLMMPSIESPSATAFDARLSRTMPMPSPTNVPSADASNARHRPDVEMAPLSVATYPAVCGKVMEAPPASAMSDSPVKTLCTAR
ncbi:Uncharacterised protein [Mycobacteroides abscessus subsp. abscessus]|nr:Uncharacterised protein [Mycobacteroides abscessus subsp. abscessus]